MSEITTRDLENLCELIQEDLRGNLEGIGVDEMNLICQYVVNRVDVLKERLTLPDLRFPVRKTVKCGICGKPIEPTMLSKQIQISDSDKKNNFSRDRSFNCCQRSWLIGEDAGKAVDCGTAKF